MSFDKKDRNRKKEKNKYGEGFNAKERRFNSPETKKRNNNWKEYLKNYDHEKIEEE
jgi:hypothetical protein